MSGRLTVVIPVHNEAGNLDPLVTTTIAAIEPLGRSFELVLIDDGSSSMRLRSWVSRPTSSDLTSSCQYSSPCRDR